MKTEEKAKVLVSKMQRSKDMPYQYAKQCALIAVDEIMKVIGWEEMELGVDRDNYWLKVKQEINKL